MKREIAEYTYLRAFAIMLVIMGHSTYYSIYSGYGSVVCKPADSAMQSMLYFISDVIFSFHMPLYMALSGCLFRATTQRRGLQPFKPFAKGKLRRLIVPFALVNLLWSFPLKYASGYLEGSFFDALRQLALGQMALLGVSHLWFILALFHIFILAWVIERCRLRRHPIVFLVCLLVISLCAKQFFPAIFCIRAAFYHLFWFYIGFYFEACRGRINSWIDERVGWPAVVGACALFPTAYFILHKVYSFVPHYILLYSMAALGMAIAYAFCYKAQQITPPNLLKYVKRTSDDSYGLYLYSDPLNYVLIALVVDFALEPLFGSNVFSLAFYLFRIGFQLGVSWLALLLVRRVGARRGS